MHLTLRKETPAALEMGIYNVFIVSKSGGLIYHHDRPESASHAPYEVEKTFSYPLEVRLRSEPNRVAVDFGGRDGVRVGHSLMAANGVAVGGGGRMDNGEDVFKVRTRVFLSPSVVCGEARTQKPSFSLL